MVQMSTFFTGLARSLSIKSPKKSCLDVESEAADDLAKQARKKELMLSTSGIVDANSSTNFASVYSKRGQKGINQDCFVVWEEFGCQKDMIFCGVFDGHGPWGHLVSKRVRELMPTILLSNWQKALVEDVLNQDCSMEFDRNCSLSDIWKQSYLKTCSAIDRELEQHPGIDSFYSGSTALSIVRQGDMIVIANVGDSRAVIATASDDGTLVAVQLTVDLKPNLPEERERIKQSRGRVLSSHDEPGVYRVWMPRGDTYEGPGLALSRAFGDYFIKDFGLISQPEVTERRVTNRDHFAILATDGVWDVITNQEAVDVVSSTPEREESAKRLVKSAVRAWKRKKRGNARDDISIICLFFHNSEDDCSMSDQTKLAKDSY